jgi:hypothetical protein
MNIYVNRNLFMKGYVQQKKKGQRLDVGYEKRIFMDGTRAECTHLNIFPIKFIGEVIRLLQLVFCVKIPHKMH